MSLDHCCCCAHNSKRRMNVELNEQCDVCALQSIAVINSVESNRLVSLVHAMPPRVTPAHNVCMILSRAHFYSFIVHMIGFCVKQRPSLELRCLCFRLLSLLLLRFAFTRNVGSRWSCQRKHQNITAFSSRTWVWHGISQDTQSGGRAIMTTRE